MNGLHDSRNGNEQRVNKWFGIMVLQGRWIRFSFGWDQSQRPAFWGSERGYRVAAFNFRSDLGIVVRTQVSTVVILP
jgi:hypothetical protein